MDLTMDVYAIMLQMTDLIYLQLKLIFILTSLISVLLFVNYGLKELIWWIAGWNSTGHSFNKKVVVITGAGSGIGYGLMLKMLESGALVVGLDINVTALEKLSKTLGGDSSDAPKSLLFFQCDLSKERFGWLFLLEFESTLSLSFPIL